MAVEVRVQVHLFLERVCVIEDADVLVSVQPIRLDCIIFVIILLTHQVYLKPFFVYVKH